jgi:3'(2'), 5'-bisphosphate nucleotidase
MTTPLRDDELESILAIARRAAKLIQEVYATPFEVEMKGPGDPVTRADREANELVCAALRERFPEVAILAEESVPKDASEIANRLENDRVFFVDPLDGTREFAARNGEFAVMIGLTVHGRPELGVVVAPTTGEAFAARVGGAAFREDGRGERSPLRVSTAADPSQARLMVSRSKRPRLVDPLMQTLGLREAIACGSVGLKVGRIVSGDAELYVHGGGGAQRWDTCAPEAILIAAGGRFTDLDGKLIDYRASDLTVHTGIVASNGPLHDQVLAVTRARAAVR